MNGSVTPVAGMLEVATPMFITACSPIMEVRPTPSKLQYALLHRLAMLRPEQTNAANSPMISSVPHRPTSSPMAAKMKSVWPAGR